MKSKFSSGVPLMIAALLVTGSLRETGNTVAAGILEIGLREEHDGLGFRRAAPNPLKNAYFGDLHLHRGYSMDAFALGTRTTPEDSIAMRWARRSSTSANRRSGSRRSTSSRSPTTPSTWALLETVDPNGPFAKTKWHTTMTSKDPRFRAGFHKVVGTFVSNKPVPEFSDPKLLRSTWDQIRGDRQEVQQARQFTSFIGFEWTSAPDVSKPAPLRDLRQQGAWPCRSGF